MSISLVVIVFYGIHMAGGWSEVVNNATSLAGYLSITQLHDRATASAAPYGLLSIVSTVAWALATSVCLISSFVSCYRRGEKLVLPAGSQLVWY